SRLKLESPLVPGAGLVDLPAVAEDVGELPVPFGPVGDKLQCLLESRLRFGEPLLPLANSPEIGQCEGSIGVQLERALETSFRIGELVQGQKREAEVVVGVGKIRLEPQCLAEACNGFVELVLLLQ